MGGRAPFPFLGLQLYFLTSESVVNDETLYAWYVHMIREAPSVLFSPEIWQFHPPLLSALASLFVWMDPLSSVRGVSILFGVMSITLLYWWGKKTGNPWIGIGAGAWLAGTFTFFQTAHYGLMDTGMMAGALLVAHGFFQPEKPNWKLVIVGVGMGLLFKRSGFLIYGLAGVGILIHLMSILSQSKKKSLEMEKIVPFTLFVLGIPLVYLFVSLFDRNILTFYDYSAGIFLIVQKNMQVLGKSIPLYWIPLSLVGLLNTRLTPNQRFFVLGWVGLFLVPLVFPYFDARYFLPALPIVALLAFLGVETLFQKVSIHFGKKKILVFVTCLVMIILAITGLSLNVAILKNNPIATGFSDEGKWLRENVQNAWIFDGIEREARYYSGIELERWGGRIVKYPSTESDFQLQLESRDKPIYAIAADWKNIYGPYYPTDEYLLQKGFVKVFGVFRSIRGENKEVIRIYEYNP